MTDTIENVRAHYNGPGLVDRIKTSLSAIAAEEQPLTVSQLAMLDQFHTRGILATAELAGAVGLKAGDTVLDLGCGIGGPARYLASMFGCSVKVSTSARVSSKPLSISPCAAASAIA